MNSVLGIAPVSRGFGFVVLDTSRHAIDWGIKDVRKDKNATSVAKAIDIVGVHRPTIMALEDWDDQKNRRQRRTKILLRDFGQAAATRGIVVVRFGKDQIRETFAEHKVETNRDIALAVAHLLPELRPLLPPPRKPWQSESYVIAIFHAAALAISCFACPREAAPLGRGGTP